MLAAEERWQHYVTPMWESTHTSYRYRNRESSLNLCVLYVSAYVAEMWVDC